MKYALVNGERKEVKRGIKNKDGKCPVCGAPVIAKPGKVRVPHWAHKSVSNCDRWWESETEWHRAWKDKFPADWQEVVLTAENGEKHIADVKTDKGWVIEFQYSHLDPDECRSRDAFYPKLIWVVNGLRRKRDKPQFLNALEKGRKVGGNKIVRIAFWDECSLLREWADGNRYIFFDFEEDVLWWPFSLIPNGPVYVLPVLRREFIKIHHDGVFEVFVKQFSNLVEINELKFRVQASNKAQLQRSRSVPKGKRREPL